MSDTRETIHPGPGELDKLILEAHVESLKDEIREWGKAYDALMESNAELRGRVRWATELFERYRDCRKHGVGMPQLPGGRLYLDDSVDDWLNQKSDYPRRPKQSPIEALKAVAAQESDNPILANLIAGVRYGLKLADENAVEGQPLHPTQME